MSDPRYIVPIDASLEDYAINFLKGFISSALAKLVFPGQPPISLEFAVGTASGTGVSFASDSITLTMGYTEDNSQIRIGDDLYPTDVVVDSAITTAVAIGILAALPVSTTLFTVSVVGGIVGGLYTYFDPFVEDGLAELNGKDQLNLLDENGKCVASLIYPDGISGIIGDKVQTLMRNAAFDDIDLAGHSIVVDGSAYDGEVFNIYATGGMFRYIDQMQDGVTWEDVMGAGPNMSSIVNGQSFVSYNDDAHDGYIVMNADGSDRIYVPFFHNGAIEDLKVYGVYLGGEISTGTHYLGKTSGNGIDDHALLIATSNGDVMEGGSGSDILLGSSGSDTFIFTAGEDKFIGGDGSDWIDLQEYGSVYTSMAATVDIIAGTATMSDGFVSITTKFSGIENIWGTDNADSISGNSQDNIFVAGEGNDTLEGGVGDDRYVFNATGDGLKIVDDADGGYLYVGNEYVMGDFIRLEDDINTTEDESLWFGKTINGNQYYASNAGSDLVIVRDTWDIVSDSIRLIGEANSGAEWHISLEEDAPEDDPIMGLANDDHSNVSTQDTTDGNEIFYDYLNSVRPMSASINVHYVMMIDVSGSMAGASLAAAKAGAISLINSASTAPGVVNHFAIITFNDTASTPSEYDAAHAINYINGLTAGGGTCFDPPYIQADTYIGNLPANTNVYTAFLSDGHSECGSGTEDGVGDVTRANSTVRAMGVGSGADLDALDAMASSGESLELTDLNNDSVIDEADAAILWNTSGRDAGSIVSVDIKVNGVTVDTIDGGDMTDSAQGLKYQNTLDISGISAVNGEYVVETTTTYDDSSTETVTRVVGDGSTTRTYSSGSNVEIIFSHTEQDYTAGSGDDRISANSLNNVLMGGAGNDTVYGGAGDDELYLGTGDNVADGGTGNDTAHYGDDASDYDIYHTSAGIHVTKSDDTIRDVLLNVEFLQFDDQIIDVRINEALGGTTDVRDMIFGDENANLIDGQRGNDQLNGLAGNDTLIGGQGNDSLFGGAGDDLYEWSIGDGNDIIDEDNLGGNDTLHFGDGIDTSDLRFMVDVVSGDTTITHIATNEGVTIIAHAEDPDYEIETFSFDTASSVTLDDVDVWWRGDETNNYIYGSTGNDTLEGAAGNDNLYGGAGNDTYVWAAGDGNDIINESNSGSSADVLHLTGGITSNDVEIYGSTNNDLVVELTATGETIRIIDGMSNDSDYHVETLLFDDTSTINLWQAREFRGGSGNDYLYGTDAFGDTLIGGAGNDQLYGYDGNDTYVWAEGDGNDIINESNSGSSADVLRLTGGITSGDVEIYGSTGNDLVVELTATGETIRITDGMSDDSDYHVETLLFDDESTVSLWQAREFHGSNGNDYLYGTDTFGDTLIGGTGNDNLYGYDGDDTYVWAEGDGNDVINEQNSGSTADVLHLTGGITASDVEIYGSTGNDLVVELTATGETIRITDGMSDDSDYHVETLLFDDTSTINLWQAREFHGSNGNDYLYGTNTFGDTLIGGTGNDNLYGYDGDDTYVWAEGDGNDLINEQNSGSSADVLHLAGGITASDVEIYGSTGNDLVVELTATGETIRITDGMSDDSDYHVETLLFDDTSTINLSQVWEIHGTASNDYLYGTSSNDTIIGGAGNDNLYGGDGDDIFVWSSGDGSDYIDEQNSGSNADVLHLTGGIVYSDLSFAAGSSNDLVITHNPTGETITINNHYSDSDYQVETILFDDMSTFDMTSIM